MLKLDLIQRDKIRLLLVDDYSLIRAGMRVLLEETGELAVVAEASDGETALTLIGEHQPDVVLMDIAMPDGDGLAAALRISAEYPAVRVIILSMHASETYVTKALQAGVSGYVMKDAHITELRRAIEAVMAGEIYLTPAISQHVAQVIRRLPAQSAALPTPADVEALTARQLQILKLIADGCSTKQIAELLCISVKTVETHRANIMKRLDIYDIASLTRFALREKIISM